jgi:hypothetical protein
MEPSAVRRWRRSGPLRLTAVWLGAVVVVAVGAQLVWHAGGVIVVGLALLLAWTLYAAAAYRTIFTLTNDWADLSEFMREAKVEKSALVSCRYRYVARQRGIREPVFELVDGQGRSLFLYRLGWGARRRELFRALAEWLTESGVELDERTRNALAGAQGR